MDRPDRSRRVPLMRKTPLPVFALASLIVVGCSTGPAAAPSESPALKHEKVKIATISPSANQAPLFVALEKGYFANAGLDVEYSQSNDALAALAALGNGALDAGVTVPSAGLFNLVHDGIDTKIVSSMGAVPAQGAPVGLVVRKDLVDSGRVKTVADLKGRSFGLAGGRTAVMAYFT